MAYKLIVSTEAHRDIDEITAYIACDLNNTQAAISFIDNVESSYRYIVENLHMYGMCADARLRKEGYRKIPLKNHLLIYRVDDAQKHVFIVRVLYDSRDYAKLL